MEPRENAPQPPIPPELAEIIEIKENLKARRKLAKANAPKTKKAQKRKSKKQKKKKMLVQNLFSKDKDVWIKTEENEHKSDVLTEAHNSSDTGTSNMDSSDYTSKDNQSEDSSEQDFFEQIFSKQIDHINSKFDAHTSFLESMFEKLVIDVTNIKDASLRNFVEERDSIVNKLEALKKEYNSDVLEVGWMTSQQHEEELSDLVHQNQEIRQILQKRGLYIKYPSSDLPVYNDSFYDAESGEEKI